MGCWCYFDDDHGRGKGQPIDDLDGVCKTLHEGYECAMRDAEAEGTTCVPWEVAYVSAIGGATTTLQEACMMPIQVTCVLAEPVQLKETLLNL